MNWQRRSLLARIGLWIVGSVALGLPWLPAPLVRGEEQLPQPTKKDSPARAKPKDVVLTTSIEPPVARPGTTVSYRVTAKLSPGWHIYTHTRSEEGEGPRPTKFDLFDLGGLEVAGDWKASREPEAKPEPAFDNQVFEFFDDEVTWSIPLRVPAQMPPGKVVVRCQASYQICNAVSCSFPGRWTLPEASLTVSAGTAEAPSEVAEPGPGGAVRPSPAQKDTLARLLPKGVRIVPSVDPEEVRPGSSLRYLVTAILEPGLHIYAASKTDDGMPGPVPTTFDLFDPGPFEVVGEWRASRPPEARPEPAFDNRIVEFFEGEVTWSIELRAPQEATPGVHPIRVQVGYQICDERSCFPPVRQTLPEVTVRVVTSDAIPPPESAREATDNLAARAAAGESEGVRGGGRSADSGGSEPGAESRIAGSAPAPPTAPPAIENRVTDPESRGTELAAAAAPPVSEIARKAEQGMLPFLIASAIGGLFALVMPCVWPMIPITVNFFVKQGQGGRGRATTLAIIYCLAIIAIFTSVGVMFSFFFSATSLQNLANNPWLNFLVAGLFFAFGLSLLGLFELRLPSFLLNVSAQGEARGGLIGVVFMALTLTITSFTCTFPVVGGLLVMAAAGNFLYPILGLATFSAVLAFPFFLLALAPGLLATVPRSGDWMNSVKVVGGLIEIGAAFKFLNTAELGFVTPENAWFDANVVLTSWIALSAVCGFYLLGFFKTNHDYDEVKVGAGRMVFGTLFLGLALYMTPALFGRAPDSLVWDRLIVGILPPDSSEFTAAARVASLGDSGGATLSDIRATSSDPSQAEREEKKAHGVLWGLSFDQAVEQAAREQRPILIDFTGVNCANCRLMEKRVLPRPEIVELLKEFVTVQLYTDFVPIASISAEQRRGLAEKNQLRQLDLAQEATNPFYVVLTPDGKLQSSIGGYNEPPVFQRFLSSALEKIREDVRMARVGRGDLRSTQTP